MGPDLITNVLRRRRKFGYRENKTQRVCHVTVEAEVEVMQL